MEKVATDKMIRFSKLIEAVTGFKAPSTKGRSEVVAYIDKYRQIYYDIINDNLQGEVMNFRGDH